MSPSSTQKKKPAVACSLYSERRKARNRNTIPPMGIGVKKRATPSIARIMEAIVSRKAQITPAKPPEGIVPERKTQLIFSAVFSSSNPLYSFCFHFIMFAQGYKCCDRLVNHVYHMKN